MSTACRSILEERVRATLVEDEARIPVVVGLCGTGRTTLLHQVQADLAPGTCQYVNVERTATTPERFLRALTVSSPFGMSREVGRPASPREAFDAMLGFLSSARCAEGSPATFLLDEVLEFRTFESFPGLRHALPEILAVLASSENRFALTSRYVTRSERALSGASPHFLLAPIQAMSLADVRAMLDDAGDLARAPFRAGEPDDGPAAAVLALTGGRPAYVRALIDTMSSAGQAGARDPVAALARALSPAGRLSAICGHSYELRLHRARGYGALKAILEILCEQEPLTLTEISQRLGRTPGSTKDYLSWLDDVDLVSVSQKRYRVRDPLMRVWCRLHCQAAGPDDEELAGETRAYAQACLGGSERHPVAEVVRT